MLKTQEIVAQKVQVLVFELLMNEQVVMLSSKTIFKVGFKNLLLLQLHSIILGFHIMRNIQAYRNNMKRNVVHSPHVENKYS